MMYLYVRIVLCIAQENSKTDVVRGWKMRGADFSQAENVRCVLSTGGQFLRRFFRAYSIGNTD